MRLIGGGYAEFTTVAARQCRILPDDLPTAEGALAEPVAVGAARGHALGPEAGRPRAHPRRRTDRAARRLLGAAAWRARTSSSPTSTAIRRNGRPPSARPASRFPGQVSRTSSANQTGGAPDIVFECVGKRGLIDFACRLVRPHGTVVGVGLCVGGDEWDPFAALSKEIQIVFAVFFTMAEFEAALEALGPGRFRPQALITERIGFAEVAGDLRGASPPHDTMQGADHGRCRLIGKPGGR